MLLTARCFKTCACAPQTIESQFNASIWPSCQQRQKCSGCISRLLEQAWCYKTSQRPQNPSLLHLNHCTWTPAPQKNTQKSILWSGKSGYIASRNIAFELITSSRRPTELAHMFELMISTLIVTCEWCIRATEPPGWPLDRCVYLFSRLDPVWNLFSLFFVPQGSLYAQKSSEKRADKAKTANVTAMFDDSGAGIIEPSVSGLTKCQAAGIDGQFLALSQRRWDQTKDLWKPVTVYCILCQPVPFRTLSVYFSSEGEDMKTGYQRVEMTTKGFVDRIWQLKHLVSTLLPALMSTPRHAQTSSAPRTITSWRAFIVAECCLLLILPHTWHSCAGQKINASLSQLKPPSLANNWKTKGQLKFQPCRAPQPCSPYAWEINSHSKWMETLTALKNVSAVIFLIGEYRDL